jgi:predicted DNA-binding transcriptional regulator AlpA
VQEVFVTYPQLRTHGITYCRLHLNRLMARGGFPAAVWLSSNRKVWRVTDIERWKASRPMNRPSATDNAA